MMRHIHNKLNHRPVYFVSLYKTFIALENYWSFSIVGNDISKLPYNSRFGYVMQVITPQE